MGGGIKALILVSVTASQVTTRQEITLKPTEIYTEIKSQAEAVCRVPILM